MVGHWAIQLEGTPPGGEAVRRHTPRQGLRMNARTRLLGALVALCRRRSGVGRRDPGTPRHCSMSGARIGLAAVLVALAIPATAQAHLRTGRVAFDYRADVSPLHAPLAGAVVVEIYRSDLALRLTTRGRHQVLVRGYLGEPLLRIGPAGVEVDASSPTAAGTGLLKGTRATTDSRWRLRTQARSIAWHDARVRGLPPGTERRRWSIPLVLDGRRTRIEGTLWRVQAPSPWPWLAVAAGFAAGTALVLRIRRPRRLRQASAALGTAAAVAALVTAAGFALSSTASQGTWIESANELVFALAGLAIVARGSPDARGLAGGGLGLLGLAAGLTKFPVFLHGVVLSALPSEAARLAVAVAISAGAAATVVGLVVFFDVLEHYEEPSDLVRRLEAGETRERSSSKST